MSYGFCYLRIVNVLAFNVWLLKTKTSFLVKSFQIDGKEQCQYTEACEYNERYGVVVRDEVGTSVLCCDYRRVVLVG